MTEAPKQNHDDTVHALVKAAEAADEAITWYYTAWRGADATASESENLYEGHLLALNALEAALAQFKEGGE